jgi:hypothetical protein
MADSLVAFNSPSLLLAVDQSRVQLQLNGVVQEQVTMCTSGNAANSTNDDDYFFP